MPYKSASIYNKSYSIFLKLTQQEVTLISLGYQKETPLMLSDQQKYNVYDNDCPARAFLDRLADRWTLLIIDLLKKKTYRFNQLKKEVEGISQKVLSQKLKQLERDGLISRHPYATVPVTVEYKLTDLGYSFSETISNFIDWAEDNVKHVTTAQKNYDKAQE